MSAGPRIGQNLVKREERGGVQAGSGRSGLAGGWAVVGKCRLGKEKCSPVARSKGGRVQGGLLGSHGEACRERVRVQTGPQEVGRRGGREPMPWAATNSHVAVEVHLSPPPWVLTWWGTRASVKGMCPSAPFCAGARWSSLVPQPLSFPPLPGPPGCSLLHLDTPVPPPPTSATTFSDLSPPFRVALTICHLCKTLGCASPFSTFPCGLWSRIISMRLLAGPPHLCVLHPVWGPVPWGPRFMRSPWAS